MGESYQGNKTYGGLTIGEILGIAGASLGRRRIGPLQPGFALSPLGGVLMGHEEARREKFMRHKLATGFPYGGDPEAIQRYLLGSETAEGQTAGLAMLTRKPSTYGQPVSPEREAQEIRVHQAEAKVPNWQDPEYLKQRGDEWERRRREQEGFQVSQAKRREAFLEGRQARETPKTVAASRRARLVEIKEQAGMVSSEMNAVAKQLEGVGLGEENAPMRAELTGQIAELRRRHAELLGEYGDLARGAPVKKNGAQAPAQAGKDDAGDPIVGETPEHGPIRESEIQHTMKTMGLTREQVLQQLGLAPGINTKLPSANGTGEGASMTGTIGR